MVKINSVAHMPIKLQMVTTADSFADKVTKAIYYEVTKKLGTKDFQDAIRRGTKAILRKHLLEHETYQSMVAYDGKLRAQLGVINSESAMNSLVRTWVDSTTVSIRRPKIIGHRVLGTVLTVKAIQADYQDVLSQAYASYTTEKGQQIPWLDWLLTKGVGILVASHTAMRIPSPSVRSRTGTNTIMIKTRGRGWGVPEEFAGTPDDNYATQAVVNAMPEIEDLVFSETQRRL